MKTRFCAIAVGAIGLWICGCGTQENGQTQATAENRAADQSTNHESPLAAGGNPVAEGEARSSGSTSDERIKSSAAGQQAISSTEEFQAVFDSFPAGSSIPAILRKCMSTNEEIQDAGVDELESLEAQMAEGKLSVQEVRGLFDAYTTLTLPKPLIGPSPQQDISTVLYLVPETPARQLVPTIKSLYPSSSWRQQNAFLVMLSGARSREGAEAFVHCIQEHGWPDPTYPRVFWDLDRLHEHADVLYPALLVGAPDEVAFSLAELLGETNRNQVSAESLTPLVPMVRQRLRKAISDTQSLQEQPDEWFDEEYYSARNRLITYLRIAGRTNDPESVALLDKALTFRDPLVVIEAVDACLQRDHAVSADVIEAMAANHLTRSSLFESLRRLDRLEQFPARWHTWDAFACSEMVGWLSHPAELGAPPAAIEKMRVVQADSEGEDYSIYVWRYREEEESEWLVGISGPYILKGTPQPVHGHLTFSQFTPWDEATPEEHVNAVIEMFAKYAESNE